MNVPGEDTRRYAIGPTDERSKHPYAIAFVVFAIMTITGTIFFAGCYQVWEWIAR